jgi:hypothetical protein
MDATMMDVPLSLNHVLERAGRYFGIPAAGGVTHTLNLRLSAREIGAIAADAQDRFLILDDILLLLYRQFAPAHTFEKVIVVPYSGAAVSGEFVDYEAFLASGDPEITASYYGLAPSDDKFTSDGWLRTGDVATME